MNTDNHQGAAAFADHKNEARARQLIDQTIADTAFGAAIPTSTARVIAGAVHHGPGSALGHFAATGELDRLRALSELERTNARHLPSDWWLALDAYLRAGGTERGDRRPSQEPLHGDDDDES